VGNSYLLLKTIHIVGAVVFLGNIIVTGWWKAMADKHGSPIVIAFAQRQITLTDFIFTGGGVALMSVGAFGNVYLNGLDLFGTNWLYKGFLIFTISGAIWVFILIPIQYKQAKLARTFEAGGEIPELYWRLNRQWYIWGILDTLIPLAAISWMVFKPI
jgi:uncharacterized membrane protein